MGNRTRSKRNSPSNDELMTATPAAAAPTGKRRRYEPATPTFPLQSDLPTASTSTSTPTSASTSSISASTITLDSASSSTAMSIPCGTPLPSRTTSIGKGKRKEKINNDDHMDWKAGTPDSVEGHHGCDANADADDFNVGDYDIDGYDPDSFCETGSLAGDDEFFVEQDWKDLELEESGLDSTSVKQMLEKVFHAAELEKEVSDALSGDNDLKYSINGEEISWKEMRTCELPQGKELFDALAIRIRDDPSVTESIQPDPGESPSDVSAAIIKAITSIRAKEDNTQTTATQLRTDDYAQFERSKGIAKWAGQIVAPGSGTGTETLTTVFHFPTAEHPPLGIMNSSNSYTEYAVFKRFGDDFCKFASAEDIIRVQSSVKTSGQHHPLTEDQARISKELIIKPFVERMRTEGNLLLATYGAPVRHQVLAWLKDYNVVISDIVIDGLVIHVLRLLGQTLSQASFLFPLSHPSRTVYDGFSLVQRLKEDYINSILAMFLNDKRCRFDSTLSRSSRSFFTTSKDDQQAAEAEEGTCPQWIKDCSKFARKARLEGRLIHRYEVMEHNVESLVIIEAYAKSKHIGFKASQDYRDSIYYRIQQLWVLKSKATRVKHSEMEDRAAKDELNKSEKDYWAGIIAQRLLRNEYYHANRDVLRAMVSHRYCEDKAWRDQLIKSKGFGWEDEKEKGELVLSNRRERNDNITKLIQSGGPGSVDAKEKRELVLSNRRERYDKDMKLIASGGPGSVEAKEERQLASPQPSITRKITRMMLGQDITEQEAKNDISTRWAQCNAVRKNADGLTPDEIASKLHSIRLSTPLIRNSRGVEVPIVNSFLLHWFPRYKTDPAIVDAIYYASFAARNSLPGFFGAEITNMIAKLLSERMSFQRFSGEMFRDVGRFVSVKFEPSSKSHSLTLDYEEWIKLITSKDNKTDEGIKVGRRQRGWIAGLRSRQVEIVINEERYKAWATEYCKRLKKFMLTR